MIKEKLESLHNLLPWWIRYPVAIIGAIIGGYQAMELWTAKIAYAQVKPIKSEMRYMREVQTMQYRNLNDNLNEVKQQNSIMYAEMLKRYRR